MGYFLNPALIARAADYARERGRPALLGGLVLLLNALHASAGERGLVVVSQATLARVAGGLSTRWVRDLEAELVEAGLVRRSSSVGRRRTLVLVEASELEAQSSPLGVLHKFSTSYETEDFARFNTGTPVPVSTGTPVPVSAPRCNDRARVQKEREKEESGYSLLERRTLQRGLEALSNAIEASRPQALALARLAVDLSRELQSADRAVEELRALGTWSLRTARHAPAALAVRALRARVLHARGVRETQGLFFDQALSNRLPEA